MHRLYHRALKSVRGRQELRDSRQRTGVESKETVEEGVEGRLVLLGKHSETHQQCLSEGGEPKNN